MRMPRLRCSGRKLRRLVGGRLPRNYRCRARYLMVAVPMAGIRRRCSPRITIAVPARWCMDCQARIVRGPYVTFCPRCYEMRP